MKFLHFIKNYMLHINHFECFQIWNWIGPKFVFYSIVVTLEVGHSEWICLNIRCFWCKYMMIDPIYEVFVFCNGFRLWHMTQPKVAMWHINGNLEIYLFKYIYIYVCILMMMFQRN
jgi:hypothetical protein